MRSYTVHRCLVKFPFVHTYRNLWIAVSPVGLYPPPPLFLRIFDVNFFRHVGKMMNIWGVQLSKNYGRLLDRVLCTAPHIYSLFYRALVLSPVLYMYAVGNFYFLVGYFFYYLLLTSPNSSPD